MAWGWKAFGAALGAAFGGPLGAGIGALVGHGVDNYTSSDKKNEKDEVTILGVASFLSQVARADGKQTELERELIVEICASLAQGVDPKHIRFMIEKAQNNTQIFEKVVQSARTKPELRMALLMYAWRVAAKDLKISPEEVACIDRLAERMGATKEESDICRQPFYREVRNDDYETLGLPFNAKPEQVKAAFREMSIKYHPDRHHSAPEELRELASERFAKVKNAYQAITSGGGGGKLQAKLADSSQLTVPVEREVVMCFVCSQKVRLPDPASHAKARCPKCQALLLFESTTARKWAAHNPG
ncbi:DnaJ domain-containing protein [Sulfidibacter corallicola]|uniref:DnaJ domain-containing protein n=1 Tax=Sulfidibacter corallicola TaxID=2818388 RepID=A0A8A4TGR6_SULCO|nr:DnaJ domain-containing protein [Sulfidibacter corallicola]QTD49116.1 DnaJ domain-containing protein [Sulfidibacter corallicola]